MDAHKVRQFCLTFPGCTEEIQWNDHLLFKVGGKTFVFSGMDINSGISVKCLEESFNELIELIGIIPAPYLARNNWIKIDTTECNLKRNEIEELIAVSYDLIFRKLPKKIQATIRK